MSYDNDIDYPDISSDEYKAIEKAVRQAIRLLLKEGHPYEPSKLLRRQEVVYALKGAHIPKELLDLMVLPLMDCREWIWEEYAEKKLWTLEEAAALSVGMDPFIFQLEPGQYYNGWRVEREQALSRTREAILLRELPAVSEGEVSYMTPYAFCRWALEAGLLNSDLAKPLRGLAQDPQYIQHLPTFDEMRERFTTYAQQRLFADGLSQAEQRRRALYGFAVFAKLDNPKLTREQIAKLAFESISEDCQKVQGFTYNTIRNDLMKLDQKADPSSTQNQPFLNLVPSDREIESTDPTHRWWSRWRPVIAQELPWLMLPE